MWGRLMSLIEKDCESFLFQFVSEARFCYKFQFIFISSWGYPRTVWIFSEYSGYFLASCVSIPPLYYCTCLGEDILPVFSILAAISVYWSLSPVSSIVKAGNTPWTGLSNLSQASNQTWELFDHILPLFTFFCCIIFSILSNPTSRFRKPSLRIPMCL